MRRFCFKAQHWCQAAHRETFGGRWQMDDDPRGARTSEGARTAVWKEASSQRISAAKRWQGVKSAKR